MSVVGAPPKRKPCLSNCRTCDHIRSVTNVGDGHCYMFFQAPEGACVKHTGMHGPLPLLQALLRSLPPESYGHRR